jgi:RHS repeat-associated protein
MRKRTLSVVPLLAGALFFLNGNLQAQDGAVFTPAAYGSSSNVGGTVRTWVARKPETNPNNITISSNMQDFPLVTQYVDGLGRAVQTVVKQGSQPTGGSTYDLASAKVYDAYGREARIYLPFADTSSSGSFQLNPFQQQSAFYSGSSSPIYGQGETYYYGKTEYEASPFARAQKTFAPGDNWVHGGKGVETHYWNNTTTDSVRIWSVTDNSGNFGSYSTTRLYAAGTLYKTIMIDERGNQVVEFKDKEGNTILKKVQLTAAIDTGQGSGHYGWLCTYYIYDPVARLRAVIQPVGVEQLLQHSWDLTWNSSVLLNEQCFRYEYDNLNRLIINKVAGAGTVYLVYDTRNRPVFMQDSALRAQNKWLTTLYDPLNRSVATGLMTYTASRSVLQDSVDNRTITPAQLDDRVLTGGSHTGTEQARLSINMETDFETTTGGEFTAEINPDLAYSQETSVVDGMTVHKNPILSASTFETLTQTGYDDYASIPSGLSGTLNATWITSTNFITSGLNSSPDYVQSITQSTRTLGMVTWTKAKVLGSSSQFLSKDIIYDDKGRAIQLQSVNQTTGLDVATIQYDFEGKVIRSHMRHQAVLTATTKTYEIGAKSTYDNLGRVTKTEKQLNGGGWKTISQVVYDAVGQVKQKKVGTDPTNSSNPLETLNYDYNIRGWLLGMNRGYVTDTSSTANYFGFDLGYDKTTIASVGSYGAAAFNGNIAGTVWKSKGDGVIRKYDFTYDPVNRLLKADFTQREVGGWSNGNVNFSVKMGDGSNPLSAYDANGNIQLMQQWGLKIGGSSQIDSLKYKYYDYTNRLQNVIDYKNDTATRLGDFRSSKLYIDAIGTKSSSAIDYTYDDNGNLKKDRNKDIGDGSNDGIVYNFLNLPQTVTVRTTGGAVKGTIAYTYDAEGNKLKKVTTEGSKVTTTLYMIGTYVNDTIQFIAHEEGRIRYRKDSSDFVYDYFLKDQLGNTRIVLTEEQQLDPYVAVTFEDGTTTNEQIYYENANTGRTTKPGAFTVNSNSSAKAQLLQKSTQSIGSGKLLKVMAGDRIHAKVDYYIPTATTDNNTADGLNALLSQLGTLLNGATAPAALKGSSSTITGALNNQSAFATTFMGPQVGSGGSMPKAYLNIVFFDEQFKFVPQNSESVQVTTMGGSGYQLSRMGGSAISVPKNGYVYVYISNESNNLVYFDNLQVSHERGRMLEETHYYAFGLAMAGISSKAMGKMENAYKFNGGTELNNDLGIATYETTYRGYDAQIGRFGQVDPMADNYSNWSPYQFSYDNPIAFNDPSGAAGEGSNDHGGKYVQDDYGNWTYIPYGSSEEAFFAGSRYASQYDMWGSYNGMATSFDDAWKNYNGGMITSTMAAMYYAYRWGSQVSGVSATSAEGGYNVNYTVTHPNEFSDGNNHTYFGSNDEVRNGINGMIEGNGSEGEKRSSGLRGPDYFSLNISISIIGPIGWNITASLDRYGHFYFSPLGISIGKSSGTYSGSLTAGWLNQPNQPSAGQLNNFLSGNGFNFGGGYYVGGGISYTPGAGTATNIGAYTPQFGGSYNYTPSFFIGSTNLTW